MDSICLIYLFIQFNFIFLLEDRGKIRVEDKIKKKSKKKEKSKNKEKSMKSKK